MLRSVSPAILLAVAAGSLYAQCEPSPQVRRILDNADKALRNEEGLSQAEVNVRRAAILDKGLEQFPHDYYLVSSRTNAEPDADARFRRAQSAWQKHPDQPAYTLVYARVLMGRDTAETIRLLETLTKSHPEFTRAHYILAYPGGGKFKNPVREKAELERFLAACPAPLDTGAIDLVSNYGAKEQSAKLSAAVRQRLEKEDDPLLSPVWESLWRAEFKARPPAEHAALRKQIADDLVRLDRNPDTDQLRWMEFLQYGDESAGDLAAANDVKTRIIDRFPKSSAAKSILEERWSKEHPYPRNGGQAQIEAWTREASKTYEEWTKQWPDDPHLYVSFFSFLTRMPDAAVGRIADAGNRLLAICRKNPNWYMIPPVEFEVADAFLKHKTNLDKVPGLIDQGYRATVKRYENDLRDDRNTPEDVARSEDSITRFGIDRARMMLDYYEAAKQPGKARAIEADLAELHPAKPYGKSLLLQVQAHAAELLGRKLDALLMYRSALDLRPPAQRAQGGKDLLAENVERLWKELGGTPAARPLLSSQAKVQESTDSRWERPKNPLPAFTLSDFEGKSLKLADLAGKAVLINLWATWCGPCRAEHPEFQKLYEKLKGRSDVVVLTFNIDDDLSRVVPYVKENKYTFPVLSASDFVRDYLSSIAIPQNWFLDPTGKLQWIQIGYGGDPRWQETMLAKLEEVLKTRP